MAKRTDGQTVDFFSLSLETRAMAVGDDAWRKDHQESLDLMFDGRLEPYGHGEVQLLTYRIKDKSAILDLFLLFFGGFTASDEVMQYAERYYCEHQREINEILEPFTEGVKSPYLMALIQNYALVCMTPQRVFYTLVLFGMYLQGIDISLVLRDCIQDYGLSVIDSFFACQLPEGFSILDTSRDNPSRKVSLDAIDRLLTWFMGNGEDGMPACIIDAMLYELWKNDMVDLLMRYVESGDFESDFNMENASATTDEVKMDDLSHFMFEVLKLPYMEDCEMDVGGLSLPFWSLSKSSKGLHPHLNGKLVNYMYQSTWMTRLLSMLNLYVRQYVDYRLQTDVQPETQIEVQEVRTKADVEQITRLKKQLEKKQGVINAFEINKQKAIQGREEKIKALEEELLFYKEQKTCSEELQKLEQAVQEDVSVEDMIDGLQDCSLVVIGGHESWITRMRSVLPFIRFGSRKVGDLPHITNSVDAVFFKSDQLSHKMYFKVKSMCKACGVPFYYISGTAYKECVKQMYMQIYCSK